MEQLELPFKKPLEIKLDIGDKRVLYLYQRGIHSLNFTKWWFKEFYDINLKEEEINTLLEKL